MGSDTMVALGRATVDGSTILGQNCNSQLDRPMRLSSTPASRHSVGEHVRTQFLELPQPRQTHRVFGVQPYDDWGYVHGLNERQVAVACVPLCDSLMHAEPALQGTDLVRLLLERCATALQAVDWLAELLAQYSQAIGPNFLENLARENIFLVADPAEAYVVETAGPFWVYQEIKEVRAVSDLRIIRQDWDRIAHGLADHAYSRGWWPQDGTKLDFAGALGESPLLHPDALHRWGRATLYLQEQNGHIDGSFVRKILCDHETDFPLSREQFPSICRHATEGSSLATTLSMITSLRKEPSSLPMAWCCFGPPCSGIYLPIFLDGDIPKEMLNASSQVVAKLAGPGGQVDRRKENAGAWERLQQLQSEVELAVEEFLPEGMQMKRNGSIRELHRQTTLLMRYHQERLEAILAEVAGEADATAAHVEHAHFAL
jgi:secernin